MRKNKAVLLCAGILGASLLAGCGEISRLLPGGGSSAAEKETGTSQAGGKPSESGEMPGFEASEAGSWIPEEVPRVLSETKPSEKVRDAIIYYFEVPEEELADVRYYYNYADLDEDGTEEIIALAVGSYVSGSGGSSALILKNDGTIVECLTCVNSPIVVWDEMINGHHLLALERSGGGAETEIVALAASEDGIYANVSETETIIDPTTLTGTAILCDDLAYDEEAEYLTLAE